jgi:predicted nucleic acid-binding protein
MSFFDLASSIGRVQTFDGPSYARRPLEELPYFSRGALDGLLMLDTTVYIDRLQGKISAELREFLEDGAYEHSCIAFQEMMVSVGSLDPRDPRTKKTIDQVSAILASVNPERIFVPDVDVSIEGALLAGTLARIQGYGKEHRFRAVNDCTLFLQSQKLGTTVLTRNYADFDIMLQMIPSGRVLFY